MARDLTKRQEILERLRIAKSMLDTADFWSDSDRVDEYIERRQLKIDALQLEVNDAIDRHAASNGNLSLNRQLVQRLAVELVEHDHKGAIDRLTRYMAEVNATPEEDASG